MPAVCLPAAGLKWAGGSGRGASLFTASYDGSLRRLHVERGVTGEPNAAMQYGRSTCWRFGLACLTMLLYALMRSILQPRHATHQHQLRPAKAALPCCALLLCAELVVSSEEAEYSCFDVTGDGR